jgi:DNA-binding phage protein
MTDDPRSSRYDTADYLETPEDIAEYLEAVTEECDERVWLSALSNAARTAQRMNASEVFLSPKLRKFLERLDQAILDNPDLPAGFVRDVLLVRGEGREQATPFVPEGRRE